MASEGVGSCNGVSVGEVVNKSVSSSSTSACVGGRTADPNGCDEGRSFFLFFF